MAGFIYRNNLENGSSTRDLEDDVIPLIVYVISKSTTSFRKPLRHSSSVLSWNPCLHCLEREKLKSDVELENKNVIPVLY